MNDSPLCEDFWTPAPPRRGAVIAYARGGYYAQLFEESSEFCTPYPKGSPSVVFPRRNVAEAWALNRGAKELIYR